MWLCHIDFFHLENSLIMSWGFSIVLVAPDRPISLDAVSDFLNSTMVDRLGDTTFGKGAMSHTPSFDSR